MSHDLELLQKWPVDQNLKLKVVLVVAAAAAGLISSIELHLL